MRMVSGYGQRCPIGSYFEITREQIKDMLTNPSMRAKEDAQWVIPSSLMTRVFDEQLKKGSYGMLWVDIDKADSDLTFDTLLMYVQLNLPGVETWIYQTSSWTPEEPKYRLMFPLTEQMDGGTYVKHQRALCDLFESIEIETDRSACRPAQLCFLPNVTDASKLATYRSEIIEGGSPVGVLAHYVASIVEKDLAEANRLEAERIDREFKRALRGDDVDIFQLYNGSVNLRELMLNEYKYTQVNKDDYRSEFQTSAGGGSMICHDENRGHDRIYSLSESDENSGVGVQASSGRGVNITAFDLLKHYKFGGDEAKALKHVKNHTVLENGLTVAEHEKQKEAKKMFEAVERQKENMAIIEAPVMEAVDVCSAGELLSVGLPGLVNQQSMDADMILVGTFKNRLAILNDAFHWFTGDRWEYVDDIWVEGHVSKALDGCEKENTLQRVRNVTGQIKRRCKKYGSSDPTSRLIFFKNGVYDLDTDEMKPHDREHLNTSVFPVIYNPNARDTLWLNWLRGIFEGDLDRIVLLQEVIGWCLISDNLNIQKSVLMFGASRAGKGTINEVMLEILGESTTSFNFDTLTNPKGLNSCMRANVAFDTDAAGPKPSDSKSVMAVMKKLTSNEKVSVPQLYQNESANVRLNCKFILLANGVPKIYDDSGAMAKRWIPLHFTKSFDDVEDGGLAKKLMVDLEFIAQWALEGLKRLKKNGRFTMPQSSKEQLANLLASGSPLQPFIDSALECDADERVSAASVWNAYVQWCFENQEPEPDLRRKSAFYESLSANLVSKGVIFSSCIRVNGKVTTGFKGLKIPPKVPVMSVVK